MPAGPLQPGPRAAPAATSERVLGFHVNDIVVFGISLLVIAAVFLMVQT